MLSPALGRVLSAVGVDPPDLGFPISAQAGVYVGLAAGLAVAAGGLADSGREVVTAYWRPPAGELPSARELRS